VLEYINQNLGIGKVTTRGKAAYFTVTNQKEIKILIDIFTNNPLNTIKQINFLDFKEAFELYTNTKEKSPSLIKAIRTIKGRMNTLRLDDSIPDRRDFKITPYWLLGFVEGDGSFSVTRSYNYILAFSLIQTFKEVALFEAIKNFILDLPGEFTNRRGNSNVVSLFMGKAVNNSKPTVSIKITNTDFLKNVLIPFFDSLVWQSKKELDYQDWKSVLNLKLRGQHFTEEGVNLINTIINQMNNNRLSTRSKATEKIEVVSRELLQKEIDRLLSAPSNLEIKEDGRIFIKSLNKYYSDRGIIQVDLLDEKGSIVETFNSLADCSKYLNISPSTAGRKARDGSPVLFNNQPLYIKIKDND